MQGKSHIKGGSIASVEDYLFGDPVSSLETSKDLPNVAWLWLFALLCY